MRSPSEKTQVMRWRRLLFKQGVREETLEQLGKLTLDVPEVYALAAILDRAHEVDLDRVMQIIVALAAKQQSMVKLATEAVSHKIFDAVIVPKDGP